MRQNEKNKRNYIILGLCSILLIMTVGYAAFSQILTINGTSEITSNWCIGFDSSRTNTFTAKAGAYNTNLLTIEEPFSLPAITNNVRYIYMTVKYRESVTSQPSNLSATINLKLNATQSNGTVVPDGSGVETVRAAGIDFPVATTEDGLYYDSNTAEYYYRGANPDNYIEFSGDVWRIMSINAQGNLKIIKDDRIDLTDYSGVNPEDNYKGRFDASGNSGRRTSGYCSNSHAQEYGCNAWAAMGNFANIGVNDYYSSGSVSEDAELNTYLNGTYKNGLSDISYLQTSMIWNVGHAGTQRDTKSISEIEYMEKAYTWIGDIALPTKSEYIRINTNNNCLTASTLYNNATTCKVTNYLYKPDYSYWLLSPQSESSYGVLHVLASGKVANYDAYKTEDYVRPVLYLKSNITLTGSGTNDENIYRIS